MKHILEGYQLRRQQLIYHQDNIFDDMNHKNNGSDFFHTTYQYNQIIYIYIYVY